MPTVEAEAKRSGHVTLVEVIVQADDPHRIRLEARLDGPIWPPRRNGRPLQGWDERGLTTDVSAGRTPLGFATPATPKDDAPPVEVVFADQLEADGLPSGITAWLDRLESRVAAGEELQRVDDLWSAADAVESAGGLPEIERLGAELNRDRRIASRVSFVPERLHARLESVDVPSETFARLAQSRRS